MPRPNLNPQRSGAAGAGQSRNPIANWLQRRKEQRTEIENEAARIITNKITENEQIIIDTLSSIDFSASKLPKEVLERKSNPEHPCGELEYNTKALIALLQQNRLVKMDIRKIDEKILALALLFKQAVEQGNVQTAKAARAALARGINDIRCRIPDAQPDLAKQFVEAHTKHLDQLLTLVLHAQQADGAQLNVDNQRKDVEQAEEKHRKVIQKMKDIINSDPVKYEAYRKIRTRTDMKNRTTWTKEEREMHMFLVEQRMDLVMLDLKRQRLQQEETFLVVTKGKMEALFTNVKRMQIPTDPNLLSKFQDSINDMFRDMAETDAQIEESMKSIAYLEGQIDAFNSTPGFVLSMEAAAVAGERLLAELKKQQEIETGEAALRQKKIRNNDGILNDEEIAQRRQINEELLRELEEEEQQIYAQEHEEQTQEERQPERLVN